MRRHAILVVMLAPLAAAPARAAVPEPTQFRTDHYRDDVPATLHGAAVIHTPALAALVATGHPLLIDVLPAPVPPPDPRPGLPRMVPPHQGIPGSLWLPDVGRGALNPAAEARFRASLATLTGGKRGAPMIFTCLSRCWMSWNAAKRAVGYGYTNVIWYPDGVDGWRDAGHPTTIITPAP
jgi:PQQ-dependent catabolism-associated CXXCW motif protein